MTWAAPPPPTPDSHSGGHPGIWALPAYLHNKALAGGPCQNIL